MENTIWESKRKLDLEDMERHKAIFWEKKGFSGVNGLFNFSLFNNPLMAKWSDKQLSLHRAQTGQGVHCFD